MRTRRASAIILLTLGGVVLVFTFLQIIGLGTSSREWEISSSGIVKGSPIEKLASGYDGHEVLEIVTDLYVHGGGEQNLYFPESIELGCPMTQIKFDWEGVSVSWPKLLNVPPVTFTLLGSEDVKIVVDTRSNTYALHSSNNVQVRRFPSGYCLDVQGLEVTAGPTNVIRIFAPVKIIGSGLFTAALLLTSGISLFPWRMDLINGSNNRISAEDETT